MSSRQGRRYEAERESRPPAPTTVQYWAGRSSMQHELPPARPCPPNARPSRRPLVSAARHVGRRLCQSFAPLSSVKQLPLADMRYRRPRQTTSITQPPRQRGLQARPLLPKPSSPARPPLAGRPGSARCADSSLCLSTAHSHIQEHLLRTLSTLRIPFTICDVSMDEAGKRLWRRRGRTDGRLPGFLVDEEVRPRV